MFTCILTHLCCDVLEYCGTFCFPNPAQSPYLRTVGEKLLPAIEVLWTGWDTVHYTKQHWYNNTLVFRDGRANQW